MATACAKIEVNQCRPVEFVLIGRAELDVISRGCLNTVTNW